MGEGAVWNLRRHPLLPFTQLLLPQLHGSCEQKHGRVGDNHWVVVSNIHPYLGKIPILTSSFQMAWNHQLDQVNFCIHTHLLHLPRLLEGKLSRLAIATFRIRSNQALPWNQVQLWKRSRGEEMSGLVWQSRSLIWIYVYIFMLIHISM